MTLLVYYFPHLIELVNFDLMSSLHPHTARGNELPELEGAGRCNVIEKTRRGGFEGGL